MSQNSPRTRILRNHPDLYFISYNIYYSPYHMKVIKKKVKVSCSVMSDSLQPHEP